MPESECHIPEPLRVDVICGGDSPEREVSLSSGHAVSEALAEWGFRVERKDVPSRSDALNVLTGSDAEVFFIALHGGWGEDGRLQAVLEFLGRPYTGSGPRACACAMDKILSKAVLRQAGVRTPPYRHFLSREREADDAEARKLLERWGKVVVKPAGCGSTVGVSIVEDRRGFHDAVEHAFSFDNAVLAEKYIPGKEITVTVWHENNRVMAFPAVEIRPRKGFYTYEAKYVSGKTDYFCPAPLEEGAAKAVAEVSVKAHRALGCRGYSRVDLRLDPQGGPFVLEVNTAPGMTSTSLVPKAAAALGWSFPELCGRIVSGSIEAAKKGRASFCEARPFLNL